MKTLKQCLLKIMPLYSWVMLIVILSANHITYFETRAFTTTLKHYSLISPLDRMLPFVPFFVVFYVLAYVQWGIGFVMIARGGRDVVFRVFCGELIAKGITFFLFVLFPTTIAQLRPDPVSFAGGGIWEQLTALIYSLDAPDNLFPSIHCLESWVCFRGALRLKRAPRWYAPAMLVMTLLVFASTVLIKQHVLADIVGGVAVVEIGLFCADRFWLARRKFVEVKEEE